MAFGTLTKKGKQYKPQGNDLNSSIKTFKAKLKRWKGKLIAIIILGLLMSTSYIPEDVFSDSEGRKGK